jgi:tRNA dimethylallyltransferase
MKSDIYEYAWKYLQGELTLEEAKQRCFFEDWHLAKRQLTWFKRNRQIVWLKLNDVLPYVVSKIATKRTAIEGGV